MIANCLENGRTQGIKRNMKEAFEWYLKSAQNGHCFSQYRISNIYRDGIDPNRITERVKYGVGFDEFKIAADQDIHLMWKRKADNQKQKEKK